MPTIRPRYQVTETPDVEHALDVAARQWPDEARSKLLVRLVRAGADSLTRERHEEIGQRRAAIDANSGKYDAVFEPGYLANLRGDWPQ